jgi:hypothetical protein
MMIAYGNRDCGEKTEKLEGKKDTWRGSHQTVIIECSPRTEMTGIWPGSYSITFWMLSVDRSFCCLCLKPPQLLELELHDHKNKMNY